MEIQPTIFDGFMEHIYCLYWVLGITIILLVVSVSINIYQYKKSRKGAFKTAKNNQPEINEK